MAKILPIIFAMAVFGWGHCPNFVYDNFTLNRCAKGQEKEGFWQ
jgi:hypothetical protein